MAHFRTEYYSVMMHYQNTTRDRGSTGKYSVYVALCLRYVALPILTTVCH